MPERGRLLLVFLDGVGLAPGDPARNPLAAARLPRLAALRGGSAPVLEAEGTGAAATLRGLDATLGVPGLPQSGTGQTALLTGADAPRLFGRHFGPWVPVALRPVVSRHSVLARTRPGAVEPGRVCPRWCIPVYRHGRGAIVRPASRGRRAAIPGRSGRRWRCQTRSSIGPAGFPRRRSVSCLKRCHPQIVQQVRGSVHSNLAGME